MFISMHSILGWASFCMNYCINAAWHRDNQPVALLRCNEAQVALIAAFRSSALLGLVSLIFLLTIPHRFSLWTSFWYLWLCWQVSSPAGKWNQHLHKACQQKEAWSALKCPGRWLRWLWTSENTVDQHQQITSSPNHHRLWKLHTGLQETWNSGPLSNSPVIFLLSHGKMLLTMFRFQKWLGSSFPEDVWALWLLMHWLQLQFTPCEALSSVWIGFASQHSQACSHPCCLCLFSYQNSSFESTLHLICFDTALLEHPPLSVMTLCDLLSLWRVSMIVFWTIARSAVFPIIVLSKNKRYPQFILYGWSFIETQM